MIRNATILALSYLLVNLVMENMPFFEEYKEWFLTYHMKIWVLVFNQPLNWPRVSEGLSVILACNLTAFIVGATGFHVRDIKA